MGLGKISLGKIGFNSTFLSNQQLRFSFNINHLESSAMKAFSKYLLVAGGLVVTPLIVLIAWTVATIIQKTYSFDPPKSINGIYIGISRKDLFFRTKNTWECLSKEVEKKECDTLLWLGEYGITQSDDSFSQNGRVELEDDIVVSIKQRRNLNKYLFSFNNVEELVVQLGEPDMLSISKNLYSRTYTFLDEGWIFSFSQNNLREFVWGKASVRDTLSTPVFNPESLEYWTNEELLGLVSPSQDYKGNQYFVDGIQICPGARCPFVEGEPLGKIHTTILNPLELPGVVFEEQR